MLLRHPSGWTGTIWISMEIHAVDVRHRTQKGVKENGFETTTWLSNRLKPILSLLGKSSPAKKAQVKHSPA